MKNYTRQDLSLPNTIEYTFKSIYNVKKNFTYKEMETSNMNTKISSVKALFNNICDTLSREEINKIRTNI